MNYFDELFSKIPLKQREEMNGLLRQEWNDTIDDLLRRVWNHAVENSAGTAEKCFYSDDEGFEAMNPSTIGEEIRKLKKTG